MKTPKNFFTFSPTNSFSLKMNPKGSALPDYIYMSEREKNLLNFFIHKTSRATTIIDIGANIGLYSLSVALSNTKCKIISYEPTKETFQTFIKNIKLNKIRKIYPVNKAVFSFNSKAVLNKSKHEGLNTLGKPRRKDFIALGEEIVNCITLENIIKKQKTLIDIIKIDTEGAELPILKSANQQLSKVKSLFLECEDFNTIVFNYKPEELIRYLENNNFVVMYFSPQHNRLFFNKNILNGDYHIYAVNKKHINSIYNYL